MAEDPGQLQISIPSCLNQLSLVVQTLQSFVPHFLLTLSRENGAKSNSVPLLGSASFPRALISGLGATLLLQPNILPVMALGCSRSTSFVW